MKNVLLYCTALLMLLSACDRAKEVEEWRTGEDKYPRKYFLNSILDPQAVHASRLQSIEGSYHRQELEPLLAQGRVIKVCLTGKSYEDADHYAETAPADFARLADAVGDGNYYAPKAYSTDGGAYKHTLSSGIRSMSLTALGTYNATYPEGSDLSPITQAYWVQVERKANRSVTQGELDRIWQAYGTNVQPPFDAFVRTTRTAPLVELKGIALPAVNRGQEPMEAVHGARTGVVCYLVLKERPEQGEQTLRLTLTLMDGTVLTREATLSLGN